MSGFDSRLRTPGLPTSAAAELGTAFRRTRVVRFGLGFAVLALVGLAFLLARSLESLPTTYFATGSGGIVVLDLSTSVDVQKAQRAQRVLQALSETEGRVGLVVFSDSAYEMLPPDTRSAELEPLLPFFRVDQQLGPGGGGGASAAQDAPADLRARARGRSRSEVGRASRRGWQRHAA